MAAVVMCGAVLLGGSPSGTAAQPVDPATADTRCDEVELAPGLTRDPDRNPDGSPVAITPDARGRYVPIIMVHGWTGSSAHDDKREGAFSHKIDLSTNPSANVRADRSLIGQLQRVPGAAVYTFDYHEHSARWIDDRDIGPALGTAIDCLHRESGEKVIVIAHSMGGLATRYALSPPEGSRADEVSSVITFGTPNTGSLIAMLAAVILDVGAAVNGALAVLRLVLAVCGKAASGSLDTGTICDDLDRAVRAADSDGGRALRTGSAELAALEPFPDDVDVHALAGETTFVVPRLGWFALPWATERVPTGDLVVTADSATRGADTANMATCAYQLSAVRGLADQIGLLTRTTALGDVARPITEVSGPCYHGNLMRTVELTNQAVGIVNEDISARTPNTVRFNGIGAFSLNLTADDLDARGYVNRGNLYEGVNADCVSYAKEGEKLSFSVERKTGRVLAIRNSSGEQALRTEIGGIRVGSTLTDLRAAYAGYRIDEFVNLDFGQGTNGVVVDGPGGEIAFSLSDGPPSDYASGRATVTYLAGVGVPGHAPTPVETGC
ncbi:alpha/beta hydrolase [Actinosynnema sp. NPDC051121]